MDYKEITSKKTGKRIVFCKIEDLLLDFYQAKSINEVETHAVKDEYIIHCPFCKNEGHKKHKLYIHKDLDKGNCFVCGRAFINITNEIDNSYILPEFDSYNCSPQEFSMTDLVTINQDPLWTLDKFKYEFDDYSEVGVNYLINRNPFLRDLYKILGFKFWNDNPVMPFKYQDNIFYYQLRFVDGSSGFRYLFPKTTTKPPYILEHGDNKRFVICEGVFDAVSLLIQARDFTPFAVLGSSISDFQLNMLRSYLPSEIVVYMDDTEKSTYVAKRIKSVIDYCPVRIIPSNGEDPEEKMNRLISYGKTIEELNWIKTNDCLDLSYDY